MESQKYVSHPLYALLPADVEGFEPLAELALDITWSWNHATDEIWRRLDPTLWDLTHNPWGILQTVSRNQIERVCGDPAFRRKVDALVETKRKAMGADAWFQQAHRQSPLTCVAYFSMEFMLSEALPIYSGGLGNVAGDQLKAASDLGIPVIGIGLLYQQGYFRQLIDRDGAQQALFPYNDPGQMPITPLRASDGEWIRLQLDLPGYPILLRAWQVQVGRAKLYLLDSNDPANFAPYRGLTSELYGGGADLRLMQEMILGIGGWRLLDVLGIRPEVCHLNEGHAALAVLERAQRYMEQAGVPFETALAATRAGNIFTTHTAVAAGLDHFAPALMERYLGGYAQTRLGIPFQDLMALGREDPHDLGEDFNMAYLAVRGSGAINGVSRLHGEVSRRLFQPLFPRWPRCEVPIGHVTNGVHMRSWDSAAADELWTEASGKDRWLGTIETLEEDIRRIPDDRLWRFRSATSKSLVEYVRNRLAQQRAAAGASAELIASAQHLFDPDALTIGFARRFATYKRPNLLLKDTERLLRLLSHPRRPVQLIVAGKAHPSDRLGQDLIREWARFIERAEARPRVIFLADYDMLLAEQLVQGIDLWINTPRRPWEASGTSGMKILVNGGLNLSELDGWWAEAYSPEVGWALGDGREHGDDAAWDDIEAGALYSLLEDEVIPAFYTRDERGIPTGWVARMRESMARLTPRFSANRVVREYTERHYLPAAQAYRERSVDGAALATHICAWQRALKKNWLSLRFGEVKATTDEGKHAFETQVYLDGLEADSVRVELYAEGVEGEGPTCLEMRRGDVLVGADNAYAYHAAVPADRPAADYTARMVPRHKSAASPLEAPYILWQR